jgi:hypothetical protein
MDWSRYGGLIELTVVLAFALGWGVLELLGLRLDKKREREKQRQAAETADKESSQGSGHAERQ